MIKENSSSLSPEENLLILAARLEPDGHSRANLKKILTEKIDWNRVKTLSHRMGVSPLLYRHLSGHDYHSCVPEDVMSFLKKRYTQESIKNLRIYGQFNQIIDSFSKSEIPIIPLKGIFLAQKLYGDIALRPMSDIDILCREEDLPLVREKLIELGYTQDTAYRSTVHKELADRSLGSCHLPVFKRPGSFGVEAHFRLFFKTEVMANGITDVWDRSIPVNLDDSQIFILSPEDQLLHLISHLYTHLKKTDRDVPLYWFCDIHEWIRQNSDTIDWSLFFERAEALHIETEVGTVLNLVNKGWKWENVESALQNITTKLEDIALEDIFKGRKENYIGSLGRQIKLEWYTLGWKGWIISMLRYAFPSRNFLLDRYKPKNAHTIYIYYVIHLYRILKRLGNSVFHTIAVHLKKNAG
jgi:hypothetical protein